MTLTPYLRSSTDHGIQERSGWERRALEKILRTPPARLFRMQTPGGEMDGLRPLPPSAPPSASPRRTRAAQRCREGGGAGRGGARACVRAGGGRQRLPLQPPSLGLREVAEARAPGPGSHAAPAALCCPRSPSRPLSARALPLAPVPASEPPGRASGAPRSGRGRRAPRRGRGRSRRPRRVPPVRPARRSVRPGSRSAR